jgi:hypothetical protein
MGGLHLNILDSVRFLIENAIKVTVVAKKGPFLEAVSKVGADFIEINYNYLIDYNVQHVISKLSVKPTLIHTHPFASKDIAIKLKEFYNIPIVMTLHSINDKYIKSYESDIDIFLAVSNLVRDFIISQEINLPQEKNIQNLKIKLLKY